MEDLKIKLGNANFDVEKTVARFAGNVALYQKFLSKFIDDKSYEEFKASLANGDFTAAEGAIHTLKGVAGNLGMTDLFEISNTILTQMRAGNNDNAQLVEKLDAEYDRVIQVLNSL